MPIYIQRNGQEHGPYREEEARSYLQGGQLLANDLARNEAERGWRPLKDVLAGQIAAAQPHIQPQSSVYAVPVQTSTPIAAGTQPVTVVDIRMPFGSMVVFMIKWALASIPAVLIIWFILAIIIFLGSLLFGGLFGGFGRIH
jgi:hypothetical protein